MDLLPSSVSPAPPSPPADPGTADDARPPEEQLEWIIGRRDIATVPWGGIALCSAGVAIASALRPAVEGVPDGLLIPLALLYGTIATVITLLQGTRVMQWFARQLWVYVGGSTLLIRRAQRARRTRPWHRHGVLRPRRSDRDVRGTRPAATMERRRDHHADRSGGSGAGGQPRRHPAGCRHRPRAHPRGLGRRPDVPQRPPQSLPGRAAPQSQRRPHPHPQPSRILRAVRERPARRSQ